MPSQKESVTTQESKAIAKYMFLHFTQENLSKMQKEQNEYDALPDGKKIALKYKCMGCHKIDKKVVGPAFKDIALKFKDSKEGMFQSIKAGSTKKWESSNGAVMPPFKQINNEELKILSNWILKLNS